MRTTVRFVAFWFLTASCFSQKSTLPAEKVSSTDRRVDIVEFADFQCPFCASQAPDLRKLQADYPAVNITFKNYPLAFHKQSKGAHLAALAAEEQGKFWEMHDLIYQHAGHLTAEDFDRYALQLGLNMEKFHRSMEEPAVLGVIDKDIADGKALNITGTPTFIIAGHSLVGRQSYARLKQIVEAELKGEIWARPTQRITVDTSHAPSRGPESARVMIVEFSDFQCPFCARAVPSIEKLIQANPSDVRFVFKNFPLDFHKDSHLAHMAALAAGEQGNFWQMHDLIFAHQQSIKRADLLEFARQLRLDVAGFEKDLESPDLNAKIERDKEEGERLGIAATPTFVINGVALTGFSVEKLHAQIDGAEEAAAGGNGSVSAGRKTLLETHTSDAALPLPDLGLSLGPKDAAIKIRWYVDLTSPLTAQSAVALQQFVESHRGNVSVEFKNFPLQNHSTAMLVHEFALAAAAQGQFWPVEGLLLADARPKDRQILKSIAAQTQLDQKKLWAEIDDHKYAPVIYRDLVEAAGLGISGSPTFVVGNKKLDGANALVTLP